MFLFLTLCSGFWPYLCFCMLQNMVTQRPSPRFSVERLGIGTLVVYFLTAISVAIIWTRIHHVDVQSANVLSLLSIVYGFLCFCNGKTNSKKRRVKSTNLGSHNWSRRRVLWLQMKASRTEYVRLACKNKYGATMSMQTLYVLNVICARF